MITKTLTDSRLKTDHDHCFICGQNNSCSLGIEFHEDDKGVYAVFQPKPVHQGYRGILHGGIIASLLDEAMTQCLFCEGIKAVTGDLHVRFLHPVSFQSTVELHAEIVSVGKRLYNLKAKLLVDERISATAEGKFVPKLR